MSKPIQIDTKTFIRFWLIVAALIILVLLIEQAKTGLLVVGAALFLAIAIMPLMKKIDKLNRGKSRPGLAAGVAVGGLVVIIGLVVAVAAPVVVSETTKFVSQAPEQIQSTVSKLDWIDQLGDKIGVSDLSGQIVSTLKNAMNSVLNALPKTLFEGVGAIGSFLAALILVVVLTILFLTQGPSLLEKFLIRFDTKKHDKKITTTRRILSKIAGVISPRKRKLTTRRIADVHCAIYSFRVSFI